MFHSCASINNIQLLQIKSTPLRCTFAYIHSILLFYHKVNKISRLFFIFYFLYPLSRNAPFFPNTKTRRKNRRSSCASHTDILWYVIFLFFFHSPAKVALHPPLHDKDKSQQQEQSDQFRRRPLFRNRIQEIEKYDEHQASFQLIHRRRILRSHPGRRRISGPFGRAWLIRPGCTWRIQCASSESCSSGHTAF